MKNQFTVGTKVYLRGVEKDDLRNMVSWINDPEVTCYMIMGDRPTQLDLLIEEWETQIRNRNEIVFAVCDKKKDVMVGTTGLYSINWISRMAEYRIFIGDKNYWNKGIGTEVAKLLIEYGFKKLNLNKVWLGVNEENKGALRSYEKAGFIKEGVLRQEVFRNNEYYDAVRMSILKKEYLKLK